MIDMIKKQQQEEEMKECTFKPTRENPAKIYPTLGYKRSTYKKKKESFSFKPNVEQSFHSLQNVKQNDLPPSTEKIQ